MDINVKQVAVIGSGVMGSGIAALFASAGIKTLMLDIMPSDLDKSEINDPIARNRIVKSGFDTMLFAQPPLLMDPKDADRISIGNLEDDFEKLTTCDWIVEVVVERLKVKQDLLKRIAPVRKPNAIVSSNTSGIPLHAMSEGLDKGFRQHFLGTHFFNPVRYMKLLEVIAGTDTLPEVLQYVAEFGERRLGKGIVWAKDTPNFVGNRIGVQGIMATIAAMLTDGISVPEADALFGPAMGRPKTAIFKTCDLVGLDTLGHVAQNTYDLVPDDEQRNAFQVPPFITQMIEKNLLGKKAKSGFYKKSRSPEGKKVYKAINPNTLEYEEVSPPNFPCLASAKKAASLSDKIKAIVYGTDRGAKFAWKVLAGSLSYAAHRIPEISDTIVDIDNAMAWGYNFQLGPFQTWDAIGVPESVEKMKKDGIVVPENVTTMLAAGHTSFYKFENGKTWFYDFASGSYKEKVMSEEILLLQPLKQSGNIVKDCDSASLVDLGDGVFCCEFHTKMNALNAEIIDFMHQSLDYVNHNGIGMIYGNQAGGMPGAFSAGADLLAVAQAAQAGQMSEISAIIRGLQHAVQKSRYAAFPVVAAPYGITLGGGCEVCLGADRIVAHTELYMGLVEIGVGLLPSGGGCLNLWKKFISTIPEAVTDADISKFFVAVFMNIAMAKVTSSAADAKNNGFLNATDKIVFNRDYLVGEAKKEVIRMVGDGYAPPLKQPLKVLGDAAQGMINTELFNMQQAHFVSEYDVFLAKRIAYVLSGGDVKVGSTIDEDVILNLEVEAFIDFLKEKKTQDRIEHMLKTGKPLRN